ncbi:DUF4350 domain-containing protein [Natrialbaceae archaeon AArc-T1-2]|uniref:DUF4350 domain-containing protein n=1 Tax=Natrialbaceae archaeon AArc-T1-2 TaxID=3053904 RepID=UPI00255B135F|nr:DUF4350 domain-containing protein [Natrialbaceae archaeon AArc-T1-2]WIV66466.1 hypothetical protein QQ977_12295 [Natrialbaceae archaeon AArc-T1-2]
MSRLGTLVGIFVLVVVATVGLATVGTLVADDATEPPALETAQYDYDELAPEATPDGGEIEMDSLERDNTVLVLGDVSERDVGPLTRTLTANGHDVRFVDASAPGGLEDELEDADGVVIAGSSPAVAADDVEHVEEFVAAGGRVVVAADAGSGAVPGGLFVPPAAAGDDSATLTSSLGIYTYEGYLYNLVENDNNYLSVYAVPDDSSPVTDGVDEVVLRGAVAVGADTDTIALRTTEETRLSTSREAGTYPVAADAGDVFVIGDASFLEPENAYRGDNDVLVGNVADYLVSGQVGDVPSDDDVGDEPPERPPVDEDVADVESEDADVPE